MSSGPNFPSGDSNVFWGEIAPCEHIAQFYTDDGVLLDTLTGFIGGGLKADEATIVIATADHLRILEQRLSDSGIDVAAARSKHQYIDMLANEALLKFMVNGWPDDQLFNNFVTEIISLARKKINVFVLLVRWSQFFGQGATQRQLFGSNFFGSSCVGLRTFRFSVPIQRLDSLTTHRTR